MTPLARQGIFKASNANNDGFFIQSEYVENRIITDEAKRIFNEMDADQNRKLTDFEFFKAGKIKEQNLAEEIFFSTGHKRQQRTHYPRISKSLGQAGKTYQPLGLRCKMIKLPFSVFQGICFLSITSVRGISSISCPRIFIVTTPGKNIRS